MHISSQFMYQEQTINNMNRKFNHQDLAMIGGFIAIVTAIMFNLVNAGTI